MCLCVPTNVQIIDRYDHLYARVYAIIRVGIQINAARCMKESHAPRTKRYYTWVFYFILYVRVYHREIFFRGVKWIGS